MSNQDRIKPWAVFRCEQVNTCVARFRKRSDADAYMTILRQLDPGAKFTVAFDVPVEVN